MKCQTHGPPEIALQHHRSDLAPNRKRHHSWSPCSVTAPHHGQDVISHTLHTRLSQHGHTRNSDMSSSSIVMSMSFSTSNVNAAAVVILLDSMQSVLQIRTEPTPVLQVADIAPRDLVRRIVRRVVEEPVRLLRRDVLPVSDQQPHTLVTPFVLDDRVRNT